MPFILQSGAVKTLQKKRSQGDDIKLKERQMANCGDQCRKDDGSMAFMFASCPVFSVSSVKQTEKV